MKKTPIATLMSVYKGDNPKLLASALDSILNQQLDSDISSRIYLAIDGPVSEDIDMVIAQRAKRIHRIERIQENMGLAAALNRLIGCLEDETFLFRMDADDFSAPNRYQLQLNRMKLDSSIDILGTDIIEVDLSGGQRRRVSFCRSHEDGVGSLCWRVPVAHPTVCIRRHVFQCIPGYPQSGTNEDVALWFLCAKHGFRFGNVHEPLLTFHVSPDFWRRRSFNKAFSELRCYAAGIWSLHGLTWKYLLPLLRFGLRIAPRQVSQWAYGLSFFRSR